jgi:DNA-binding transcriptional MerR regulator
MTDFGDTPIHLEEYQFTVADVAFLSGVPQKTIRNWLTREILKVGKKHFLGRWTFNFLDVVRLRTMYDLAVRLAVPLDTAAIAAEHVAKLAMDTTKRDARTGKLLDDRDGYRPNVNLLLSMDHQGKWHALVADIKEPGRYYPPTYEEVQSSPSHAPLRRAHLVVPVYAIVRDVMEGLERLKQRTEAVEGELGDD